MWQLFHGPNALERDEALAKIIADLKKSVGDDGIADMNISRLDAGDHIDDLMRASEAIPVFSDVRLVIARNLVRTFERTKTKKRAAAEKKGAESTIVDDFDKLLVYLSHAPESTHMVFVEDETLGDTNALVKAAHTKVGGGEVHRFELPADPVKWLQSRAKKHNGAITPPAAQLLSTHIRQGNKNDRDHFEQDASTYMYKLDNELRKLIGYAGSRPVEPKDIELLVPLEDVADVFKFTDAIAARDAGVAWKEMRNILTRGEHPLVLLTHLARQTRLLIQVKDNTGMGEQELATALGVHPFVAKKTMQQAGRFRDDELRSLLHALLDADIAIKSGTMEADAALDVMVAAMCGGTR
ncbi:MAG: DNA polymerase III subunit delta [Chloroflexi bacterium]|nr:DNA polymerase III subunit delta [Chloroflexota bacterium]